MFPGTAVLSHIILLVGDYIYTHIERIVFPLDEF